MEQLKKSTASIKVSVVIPHYNREDIIPRAIASVLAQTHSNLELLIVDDGSADSTLLEKIAASFCDIRIHLIKLPTNRNGAAARNSGVRQAKGDFVAFLDSDDEWVPDKLQKQLKLAECDPTVMRLVYAATEVVTTNDGVITRSTLPRRPIMENERIADYLFLNRGFAQTSAFLLPRWLALQVPFNEELKRHQDYDLLFRLEEAGCRFVMHPNVLVKVHWEDFHVSNRGLDPEFSINFLNAYRTSFSKRAAEAFILSAVVMRLLKAGRRREAYRHFRRHCSATSLKPAQWVLLLSSFAWRDDRLARRLLSLRTNLHRARQACFPKSNFGRTQGDQS